MLLAFASGLAGCSGNLVSPKSVDITGDDFMKFNIAGFEVKPGQQVTVTLKNVGELPREAMSHNWVLLAKQTDAGKFVEAGIPRPQTDYIAMDQSNYVLAKTKMVGPGESDSVTFTAPLESGPYDYVCTFPEHYAAGMKGVMTVRP
ncbi:MAG: azurin [Spartobacteria bacterium]|nr:azurin [Spartobacteria bacterium]